MRKSLFDRLINNRFVLTTAKAVRVTSLVNPVLGMLGLTRRIPGTDLQYRLRYCDTPILVRSLFKLGEYGMLEKDASRIRTFVDLGCNVGLFPLYLCKLRRDRQVRGIVVDANPDVVTEARGNLKLNGLDQQVQACHGLAGAARTGSQEFTLTPNSMSSTADRDLLGTTIGTRRIQVPRIDIARTWADRMGEETRIDLLKMDIEGCELEFIEANEDLLSRCDRVILEFHKPKVTLTMTDQALSRLGFACLGVRDFDSDPWGIAYFGRPAPSRNAHSAD